MQSENNKLPNRKPNRLKNYDYSTPGAYFVTICTKNKKCLFGEIKNGQMQLNQVGDIVKQEICKIQTHYKNVKIEKYIVMPNHIHMIIMISSADGINPVPTKKYDIPNIIGKFKAGVTRIVGTALMQSEKNNIWQYRYHDHIVRNQAEYDEIWEYIDNNPLKWELDRFYIQEEN